MLRIEPNFKAFFKDHINLKLPSSLFSYQGGYNAIVKKLYYEQHQMNN